MTTRTTLAAVGTALAFALAGCGSSAALDEDVTQTGAQADKATEVNMTITNSTKQTLHLTSATSSGSGNHWQDRPVDLAPGQKETVSNYSAFDAEINLTYTGESDGAVFTLRGKTPSAGHNEASGSANSTSYAVDVGNDSGFHPTFSYSLEVGHTFAFTGASEAFTVPADVTSLQVTAIGGSSPGPGEGGTPATGAQISGTLAVTPGEVLTIGVGGSGNNVWNNTTGGWGMTSGDSSYRGGNGTPGAENAGGGGGATVIINSAGQIQVVAGGAGGSGAGGGGGTAYAGGDAGAGGALIGGNGRPEVNAGGKPGANTVSQGQDVPAGGNLAGGAGGGGLNGGLAGISGTGGGGGAGSSSDAGLTTPTVGTAPHPGDNMTPGTVVLRGA